MCGTIRCRPIALPVRYAPMSAEFCDRDQIQNIKLPGHCARARTRREIDDLGDEIEKPEHVKQAEQGVSHGLQRLVIAQAAQTSAG